MQERLRMTQKANRLIRLRRRINALESLGQAQSFPENHIIIRAGTMPKSCYIVLDGQVVGASPSYSGDDLIFFVMGPNSIFGEVGVLFDRPSPVTFKTTAPSKLLVLRKDLFVEAVKNDGELSFAMLESVSDKFYAAMDEIGHIRSHGINWQLCDLLLVFGERYGVAYDGKIMIDYKVTIHLLASMLGVNRASVVRGLKSLKDINLIEHINGYYCIRSLEQMRRHQTMIGERCSSSSPSASTSADG
jgi:CRP/FNR family transcriptional regulator